MVGEQRLYDRGIATKFEHGEDSRRTAWRAWRAWHGEQGEQGEDGMEDNMAPARDEGI